jgi:hypothetical protein
MHVAVFWSQGSIQKLTGTNFLFHMDYSLVLDSHLLCLDSVHCQHRNHICFHAKHQRQFKSNMYIVSKEFSGIDCLGAVVTSSFPGRSMVVYHFGIYKKAQNECS